MERYTQEWLTYNLMEIRDVIFGCVSDDRWDKIAETIQKVGKAVVQITGMNGDDSADLIVNKLIGSETERQTFFRRYGIESEFESICKQMQTNAV